MKLAASLLLGAIALAAQTTPKSALIPSSQGMYAVAKNDILKSADKIPDKLWSFQPTPDVRTIGQLFAHVADGQYEFCGAAAGTQVDKGVEKTARTKADIIAALKEAFAYCDAEYARLNDASAVELVPFFGRQMSRITIMDFNSAHTMEHYGNLVTYMRLNKIVPPSSEGQ